MNAHCRACGRAVPSPTPAQCPKCRRFTSQGDPRVFDVLVDALVTGGVATRQQDRTALLGNGIVLTHVEDDPEDARRVRRLDHTRRSFPAMRLSRAEDAKGHPVFHGEIDVGTTFTDQTVATLFAHAAHREHVRQLLRGLDDALVFGPSGIRLSTAEHEVGALDPHAVFADAGRIDALDQSLAEITPEVSPFVRASRGLSVASLVVFILGIVGFEMHHARFQPTSELVYLVMAPVPFLMFALLAIVARTTRQHAITPRAVGLSEPPARIHRRTVAHVRRRGLGQRAPRPYRSRPDRRRRRVRAPRGGREYGRARLCRDAT